MCLVNFVEQENIMATTRKHEEIIDIKSKNKWLDIHISISTRKAQLISAFTFIILVLIVIAISNPEMQSRATETILAVINALVAAFSSQKN
jgi:hypothetical protein